MSEKREAEGLAAVIDRQTCEIERLRDLLKKQCLANAKAGMDISTVEADRDRLSLEIANQSNTIEAVRASAGRLAGVVDLESAIDSTVDYDCGKGDPFSRGYNAGWKNAMHSKYDEQQHMLRARVAELEAAPCEACERVTNEDAAIIEVIRAARTVQDFLWREVNDHVGAEEFRRMFRKRLSKLDAIDLDKPYWKVEFRKRLLQVSAIAVNAIHRLDTGYDFKNKGAPSNLPQYSSAVSGTPDESEER
jgi:hypothetical protein